MHVCVCVCMLPCLCICAHAIIECFDLFSLMCVSLFFFLSLSQATDSFMTFEGHQIQGAPKILEKVQVSKATTTKSTFCLNIYLYMFNIILFTESEFPKDHARHHHRRLAAHIRWWGSDQCAWTPAGENPIVAGCKGRYIAGFALNLLSLSMHTIYTNIYEIESNPTVFVCQSILYISDIYQYIYIYIYIYIVQTRCRPTRISRMPIYRPLCSSPSALASLCSTIYLG